jgi:hypothetical protein
LRKQMADAPFSFGEMLDTSPEARRFYFQKLSGLSRCQRLAMLSGMSGVARRMAEAGIRRGHPGISDEEVRVRLAVRLYGRTVAERLFGGVPGDAR